MKTSFNLEEALVERARDAAFAFPGETLSGIVERGLVNELKKLERRHGGIPSRGVKKLRAGRPVGRKPKASR